MKLKEKTFKMVWAVEKEGRRSHLAGTAHFFPFSFKGDLRRIIAPAKTVMFEGPLDETSAARVVAAGVEQKKGAHLFDLLEADTIACITAVLGPTGRRKSLLSRYGLFLAGADTSPQALVAGMKPWRAFFVLWRIFLERKGWRGSVDMEAYRIASDLGKELVFLESIDAQIKVLENLSPEHIKSILERVEHWEAYARDYADCYLAGDAEGIKAMRHRFPTRQASVIDVRDTLFFERMRPYLQKGAAAVFVGAPHVPGILKKLKAAGYHIRKL